MISISDVMQFFRDEDKSVHRAGTSTSQAMYWSASEGQLVCSVRASMKSKTNWVMGS